MPVCLVCKARNATIRFPRSKDLRDEWISALNLPVSPTDKDRICYDHFNKSDIGIAACGQTVIRSGCVPSLVTTDSALSDHNYWVTTKTWEAGTMSVLMTVGLVLACWVPFLLLLCYLTSDLATGSVETPTCSTNRVVPADHLGKQS